MGRVVYLALKNNRKWAIAEFGHMKGKRKGKTTDAPEEEEKDE